MNTKYFIKKVIDFKEQYSVIEHVGSFFFSGVRLESFVMSHEKSVFINAKDILKEIVFHRKIARVYGIYDLSNVLIGGAITYYYLWNTLKKQLYFISTKNEHDQEEIFVDELGNVVNRIGVLESDVFFASEIAFIVVNPIYRNLGIATLLFKTMLQDICLEIGKNICMCVVLGKHAFDKEKTSLLKNVVNNSDLKNNKKLLLNTFLERNKQPQDLFCCDENAHGTRKLCEKNSFTKIGYSRFLGETWLNVIK